MLLCKTIPDPATRDSVPRCTKSPIVACIDKLLGKPLTVTQACALLFACCGIAFATVSDVQLNLRGSLLALASVLTVAATVAVAHAVKHYQHSHVTSHCMALHDIK